jgi:hypothetical protein
MLQKSILSLAFVLVASFAMAQSGTGWGIKGGLNYNGNGNFFSDATAAAEDPDRAVGYHLGIYGKLGNRIYLRPELVYTRISSTYDEGDLKISKLDIPVLLGIKVFGPLHAFAGPSFQYIINGEIQDVSVSDVEKDFTVGANLGLGVNLGRLGLEVRYERGFTENEVNFINSNILDTSGRVDTRPDQVIFSLSYRLKPGN